MSDSNKNAGSPSNVSATGSATSQNVSRAASVPQQSNAGSANTQGSNSEMPFNLNRLVLEYLTRKGYHQTEATLRIESTKIPGQQTFDLNNSNSNFTSPSTINTDRSNLQFQQQQLLSNQNASKARNFDEDPKMYARAYVLYRSWCENSLEMYKFELEKLLYPFFVYSYLTLIKRRETEEAHNYLMKYKSDHTLTHSQEIKCLLGITLPEHLEENKYSNLFLKNKYKVNLSNTSLNLILGFLNENQAIGGAILVSFLNNNFEITTHLEVQKSANENLENLEGIPEIYQLVNLGAENDDPSLKSTKAALIQDNEKPVKLGPYPPDEEFTKELEAELKHRDEKAKATETDIEDPLKQGHKKTLTEEYNENFKVDPKNEDSPAKGTLPLPQKTVYDLRRAIQEISDSRSRIKLTTSSHSHLNANGHKVYISQPALPSVCMYTFHNTNNDLTSLEFHPDSTIVAGGFQDSFIKLWSIDGSPLKSIIKNDPYNSKVDSDLPTNTSRKLVGHSGPVYGLSFSPDGKYLLSSSADSTVRLWSTDTYTALVSYKGHGGAGGSGGSASPVWDVKFSPLGHYFATASHDQTARLWSCDHIYPLRIFAGHLNDVDIVRFHPNGTYLFTGSSDKTVRMWDIARAESVRLFVGHTSPISDMAVSPDGRWLATTSVNEEDYMNNAFGLNDWANSIGGGFQPSGGKSDAKGKKEHDKEDSVSAAESAQRKAAKVPFMGSVIHVWDIASGRKLKTMRGHGQGGVHSLTWSRGGEVLVSGGADGSVRVWDVKKNTGDEIAGTQPERFVVPTTTGVEGTNGSGSATSTTGVTTSTTNGSGSSKNGIVKEYASNDHMGVYFTKKTPVYKVEFTRRNLCLAAGPFMG